MITKESLETAYCFLHQKQRVYQYSTMEWQREDIESAIDAYVDGMNPELLARIADGNPDFLRHHETFGEEMIEAVSRLEEMLFGASDSQS